LSRAHSKNLSQTYNVKRAAEILELSEQRLLEALNGTWEIPARLKVQIALELYKRRVPIKVEGEGKTGNLTMIKIIKNFLPEYDNSPDKRESLRKYEESEAAKTLGDSSEEELHQ